MSEAVKNILNDPANNNLTYTEVIAKAKEAMK